MSPPLCTRMSFTSPPVSTIAAAALPPMSLSAPMRMRRKPVISITNLAPDPNFDVGSYIASLPDAACFDGDPNLLGAVPPCMRTAKGPTVEIDDVNASTPTTAPTATEPAIATAQLPSHSDESRTKKPRLLRFAFSQPDDDERQWDEN